LLADSRRLERLTFAFGELQWRSKRGFMSMACRGDGPRFAHFGRRVLYRWADLLAWAEGRLGVPQESTSEADAHRLRA
jgi:hypothetical protein